MARKGKIFEIQHMALYDGPGIRTVIYFKGCPLRCAWCHNPEGLRRETDLFFHRDKCSGCGLCERICPNGVHSLTPQGHMLDRTRCTSCGLCASHCLNHALELSGYEVSVEELLQEILCDQVFFREEGGVTLSGGEPLLQGKFASELLTAVKDNHIHTCVETCGYVSEEILRRAAEVVDLFLFDIKEMDDERHRAFTGVGNQQILRNLRLLNELGNRIILRCPMIPGRNMRKAHYIALAQLASELSNVEAIELEPYHPLGLAKYESLGLDPALADSEFLAVEQLLEPAATIRQHTSVPVRLSTGEPL